MHEKHPAQFDEQRRARAGTSAVLRVLVAFYLVYIAWQIVKNIRSGDTTMAPAVGYGAAAVFLVSAVGIAVYVFRRWRSEVEAARLPDSEDDENTEDPET